mmetsp:Transcript_11285/g.17115  ORF Transcript_11285/g.17115 Transcript_11285/m.17115 type:complete len:203 (+) Transcript_11285:1440-2048(+)
MTQIKKFTLRKVLIDSILIIFSVLLALFIDEWRTAYNEDAETKKMLENIEVEIIENQKFVKSAIAYQESILNKVKSIVEKDSIEQKMYSKTYGFSIREIAPNGIFQGKIYDIAWSVAKDNQITNRISLEKAQILYRVYEQHKIVRDAIGNIIEVLTDRKSLKKENVRGTTILYLLTTQEYAGRLKYLDNLYTVALKELQKEP